MTRKATYVVNRTVTETAHYMIPEELAERILREGLDVYDVLEAAGWPEEEGCEVESEEVNWTDVVEA